MFPYAPGQKVTDGLTAVLIHIIRDTQVEEMFDFNLAQRADAVLIVGGVTVRAIVSEQAT